MKNRKASIKRKTFETSITLGLDLNGKGTFNIRTGDDFFDHMLSQLAKHGGLNIALKAKGDDVPDFHHLVEDVLHDVGID